MKNLFLLAAFIGIALNVSAQVDIQTYPSFNDKLSVKGNSMVEKSIIYLKDGKKVEGYMVFESDTEEPNFHYSDMQRFGYDEAGKIKLYRIKVDKMDSLLIGSRKYRFMDIKISAGIVTSTKKDAMYRILNNYNRSALILYVPTSISMIDDGTAKVPVKILWNKKENKFFQLDVAFTSFTKGISKLFGDCPSLGENLKSAKDSEPKKSLLKQAMNDDSTVKNENLALIACEQYDICEIKK